MEYVDRGVSGARDRRPALDQLLTDAKRRRVDVLVCWRLDRLGRSLKHLITLLDELQSLGVAFVSLAEGIDATTSAGKLQMHILGAIAEFERRSNSRSALGPTFMASVILAALIGGDMARGAGRIRPKGGKVARQRLPAALRASARKQHELQQQRRAERAKANQTAVTAEPKRPRRGHATDEDHLKFFEDLPPPPRRYTTLLVHRLRAPARSEFF